MAVNGAVPALVLDGNDLDLLSLQINGADVPVSTRDRAHEPVQFNAGSTLTFGRVDCRRHGRIPILEYFQLPTWHIYKYSTPESASWLSV